MWHRVTDKLPPKDRDVIVHYRDITFVATAKYFDIKKEHDWQNQEYLRVLGKKIGKFNNFGMIFYFDNENVFWHELPELPKNR